MRCHFPLSAPDPELCLARCREDPRCLAFTYVAPARRGAPAMCWLKDAIPPRRAAPDCTSGVVRRRARGEGVPPPGRRP